MRWLISLAAILAVWTPAARSAASWTVSSPNGLLTVAVSLKSNPQPYLPGERVYYRVAYKGVPVLADSPLGLDFVGAAALESDFVVVGTDSRSQDSAWENRFGARRLIPDRYRQLTISLRERKAPARRVGLIFRAYNEGIAFRYFLPRQPGMERIIMAAENTGFYFVRDSNAYVLDLGSYTSSYERNYRRIPLHDIKPAAIVGLPLLVESHGGPWVALLEADLRDYAGMYVGGVPAVPNGLACKLAPLPGMDAITMALHVGAMNELNDIYIRQKEAATLLLMPGSLRRHADPYEVVVAETPKTTPWRVLMVGEHPGALIENNYLILNLSEPCALKDTAWIRPGKAAWDWWSGSFARNVDFTPGMNTATMKHYIDFAAEHRLEYMLVDAGWATWQDILHPLPPVDIAAIINHARAKGVKVLLWVPWNAVRKQMDEAFALFEKWGASGVKIDFMQRDDQEMVNFYELVLLKAAEHRLVVNFHGACKPTGLRRTYPNLLTREGVLGLEYSKWSELASPEHDVTIPFIRMLAGPMDYTPGGFRNAARGQFKPLMTEPMTQGTRAHQLAMFVVYESALTVLADHPEAYRSQPGVAFLSQVPTVWDETRVLNGTVGEFITVARKKEGTWYLGAMTDWESRELMLPLDFLDAAEYEAEIYADGEDADRVATSLAITKRKVRAGDTLRLRLAPGGGWAAVVSPVR
ncbi:MAG: glycoside hydrolase family 97 protein [Acidobacteria bacterium]|nr:glycoside hydrolase family 97 protein [Acidobacteriota bacterium]